VVQIRLALSGAVFRTPAGLLAAGSWDVSGPGVLAVAGPTGGGKSTLLRCVAGLHPLVDGEMITAPRPLSTRLLLQHPEWQVFAPTVRAALGGSDHDVLSRADQFGLATFLDALPYQLSSGERRRLVLASLGASAAQLLLLDEPSAGLDAPGRQELWETVGVLARQRLVVVATHDWPWLLTNGIGVLWVEQLRVTAPAPAFQVSAQLAASTDLFHLVRQLKAEGAAVSAWWDSTALAEELWRGASAHR